MTLQHDAPVLAEVIPPRKRTSFVAIAAVLGQCEIRSCGRWRTPSITLKDEPK